MRQKIIIIILSSLLIFLIAQLFQTNIYNNNKSVANIHKDIAKNSQINHKSYMDLYPDLYVDSIKPVIQVEEKKMAYLTFDDGPSEITCNILNTLDAYNVKATFFILGSTMTKKGEECLKAMMKEGHLIGIHTYSHNRKKIYSSVEAFLEDFYLVYQQIYEITGVKVNIFRFPWGSTNCYYENIKQDLLTEMERRGFSYYDWTVSADDSIGHPTSSRIRKNILKDLDRWSNPIILMHDAEVNEITAKTLPDIIELIKDKGYTFDTLDHREPFHW